MPPHDRRSFLKGMGLAGLVGLVNSRLPVHALPEVPPEPVAELEQLEPAPTPAPAPVLERVDEAVRLPLEGLRNITIRSERDVDEDLIAAGGPVITVAERTELELEYEISDEVRDVFLENLIAGQLVEIDCSRVQVAALVRGYIAELETRAPVRDATILDVRILATEVTWS